MARKVNVGAAQLGAIQRDDSRASVVKRMIELMREAHARGVDLVVYPEFSLTTYFARYYMEDQDEVDAFFEREMPGLETMVLFEEAKRLGIGFHLGYAEMTEEEGRPRRFNTSILVDKSGKIVGKFRKIHLPGFPEHRPERRFQAMEKRYFEVGNLGFDVFPAFGGVVGMMICNDRRWPEAWRVLGLKGVELVLVGYNTPATTNYGQYGFEDPALRPFHSTLSMQAGSYQNSTWSVGVAKAGNEDGQELFGSSCIVNPQGEVVAKTSTWGDELITASCDLDAATFGKETIFNFAVHRKIEHYRLITEQTGAQVPWEKKAAE